MHWVQGKAKSPWESGSSLTAVLGGHPGKTGVNVAWCEGRTLKAKLSGIFSCCLSLEVAILGKSGPTHQPAAEKPQGKQKPRWDHSPGPLVNRLPKDPLRHTAASNPIQRLSPTHQRD